MNYVITEEKNDKKLMFKYSTKYLISMIKNTSNKLSNKMRFVKENEEGLL